MNLINGQAFLDIANLLDLDYLDSFEEELCLGIAKSEKYINLNSTPTKSLLNPDTGISFLEIKAKAALKYPELSPRELEWYATMKGGQSHGYVLFLKNIRRYPEFFKFKSYHEYCNKTEVAKYFEFLFDWIENQNCFKEYGRVLFFVSHPGQSGMIHKDNVGLDDVRDQYIWITGNKFSKSLFQYNPATDEKIYAPSRAVLFDNRSFHGSENHHDSAAWSLRIDGQFTDEFLDKTGTRNFFYPEEN